MLEKASSLFLTGACRLFSFPFFFFFPVSFACLHSPYVFWHQHHLLWSCVKTSPLHNRAFSQSPRGSSPLSEEQAGHALERPGKVMFVSLLPDFRCHQHLVQLLILRTVNRENASRWCPRIASGFGVASETCATLRALHSGVGCRGAVVAPPFAAPSGDSCCLPPVRRLFFSNKYLYWTFEISPLKKVAG